MLRLRAVAPTPKHEDVFVKHYRWLMSQALHLTTYDQQRAEDLVHDAYVQFTLTKPDLAQIQNVEGYLYRVLRNLHLSSLRRASLVDQIQLSILDYDSAEIGLRALSVTARLAVEEDLRRVCHYACIRRASSKIGSVLILRFFHGYYPGEIAKIMRTPRRAVEDSLRLARQEAKVYLENPQSLRLMTENQPLKAARTGITSAPDEFMHELRATIFENRSSECLSSKDIHRLYESSGSEESVVCATLAHFVSCPNCMDEVNRVLGLPLLADRSPDGSLGNEPKQKGGPGGPDSGGPSAPSVDEFARKSRRRLKDVIEHRPQELMVTVNGFVLSKYRVGLERNEQSININMTEQVGFVEVFSEQGLRLGFLDVEPPTAGSIEQRACAQFSEGRTLEMVLGYGGPWPMLRVVYIDPTLRDDFARESEPENQGRWIAQGDGEQESVATIARQLWRWLFNPRLWLRPSTITAAISLILIAVLFLTRLGPAPILAAELLRRSSAAEQSLTSRRDQVIHRIINLEERHLSSGKNTNSSRTDNLISRRRIEIWQGGEKGVKALRLYDERQQLIAGEWTGVDGTRTIYRRGVRPLGAQPAVTPGASTQLSFDEIWQLEPSASDFAALIVRTNNTSVEEHQTVYQINYEHEPVGQKAGLLRAALVLSRDDLHPVEQTLVISVDGEVREFRFTESSYERRTARTVAAGVFEPEPQLLGPVASGTASERHLKTVTSASSPSPSTSPAPVVATAELEVEVLRLLNQVGADLGDQVSVTRRREGELHVEGIVDTDMRKQELLRALSSVAGNPAVKVEISTVAEALKRQEQEKARGTSSPTSPGSVIVEQVETASNTIPAEADLRRHFSEEDARRYADHMVDRSHQIMRHAYALKRLLNQFSLEDLQALQPEARAKWLALVRSHARSFEQHSRGLRQELQPVFFPGASVPETEEFESIADDAGLMRAVERLFLLGSENNGVVRMALAISTERAKTLAIKTPQFFGALRSAEKLAFKIISVQ